MRYQNHPISFLALAGLLITLFIASSCISAGQASSTSLATDNYRLAADYSKSVRGLSLLVIKDDRIVFEEYHNGYSASRQHMLASGTKSFSGVMCAAAIEDGLIRNFDEKVSETIIEWKSDPKKSKITIRELLSLTSGIEVGPNGRPPDYSNAIKYTSTYDPGTTFEYGPVPFQVFGEVMRRKLVSRNESVLDYLRMRIFAPIGLDIGDWTSQEGQPNLPSGASLTTREWAKFGQLLLGNGKFNEKQIIKASLITELSKGTEANPNYGLTFWLNRSFNSGAKIAKSENQRGQRLRRLLNFTPETEKISTEGFGSDLPKDLYAAAGAGKQRLYIVPSRNMIIVRQGKQAKFDDHEFLRLLLLGK